MKMEKQKKIQDESEGYVCSDCGADVSIDDKVCPKCGEDISELAEDEKEEPTANFSSQRYPALRTIAGFYQVLAWIVAVIAGVGILLSLDNFERDLIKLILIFIGGTVAFITLLAASESIKVFIDIEENTRKVAEFQSSKTELE